MAPSQATHLEILRHVPRPLQPMSISASLRTVLGSTHLETQGDRKTSLTKPRDIAIDQAGVIFIQGRVYRHVRAVLSDEEDEVLIVRGSTTSTLRIFILWYAVAIY